MDIFERLRHHSTSSTRTLAVELVCDAALEVAKARIGPGPRKRSLSPNFKILRLRDIQVPVITAHTPIDVTGRYDDCVWIGRYEQGYETAGGLNLPKIMKCIGSNGRIYRELVSPPYPLTELPFLMSM